MVIAYHCIFSCYGFWLPNDPRGSWSEVVRCYELFLRGGAPTDPGTRRSVANRDHDHYLRRFTKDGLLRTPVRFTSPQAIAVVDGFKQAVLESSYAVHALAVMPDHIHAVVGRHASLAERIVGHLKTRATQALIRSGLHTFVAERRQDGRVLMVWAHGAWTVFLNEPSHVRSAVRYVNENPIKAGLREQHYSFLTPVCGAFAK